MLLFRYILGDLVPTFSVGLLIFTLVLLMDKVMRIVEWVVREGVSLLDVLKMFGCLLPSFFVLTLPTAVLLGVLLTFSRMHADNELYALKASGTSLYRLLPPVYLFGTMVTALSLFLTLWAGPRTARTFQSMFYSVASQNFLLGLKEGVFFDSLPGVVLYVENIVPEEHRIRGVFIADENLSKEEPIYYFAEEGRIEGDPEKGLFYLLLERGAVHRKAGSGRAYQVAHFDRYQVKIDLGDVLAAAGGGDRRRKTEELSLPELRQRIREREAEGKDVRKLLYALHQRIALPFATLVFCTLGVPLALLSQRAVRYTGFSLSIGVVLLYFILMQAGSGLAFAGRLPASLGAWLPNLVLGGLGVYLLWKKAEERPLKWLERYAEMVQVLQEAARRSLGGRVDEI